MKDDKLYLVHIGECIGRIQQYVEDGREAFLTSTLIQDAVIRNLQTLAESSRRLSDSVKTQHSEIAWRGISALRNILVHDYFGVNLDRVWEVIERELPQLKNQVEALLRELGETS